MAKETKKKLGAVKAPEKEEKKEAKKPAFEVFVSVNGEEMKLKGNDLAKVLGEVKLGAVNTRVSVSVQKGKNLASKELKAFEAKRIFTGLPNTNLDLLVINLNRFLA